MLHGQPMWGWAWGMELKQIDEEKREPEKSTSTTLCGIGIHYNIGVLFICVLHYS